MDRDDGRASHAAARNAASSDSGFFGRRSAALTVMGRENLDELPVMSDGHFQGIVTRSNLLRLLQARRELEA
jgi:signal-transduction protein with cAMP-binding, CBS, and nucleotidyltransferase domain